MTDRELEQRLRAWYAAQVAATETAPEDLRESLAAIPETNRTPLRPITRRRGVTLLAAAALVAVGGAFAAGSGLVRLTAVVPPSPSTADLTTPGPSAIETPSQPSTPTPTANVRAGGLIAFIRGVDKGRTCLRPTSSCLTSRLWVVGSDGKGAREVVADGVGWQALIGWSWDGTRLLYTDDEKLYLTDLNGSQPQSLDTGCPVVPPETPLACMRDSGVVLSPDGQRIAFVRESSDKDGNWSESAIATMDLQTGQVVVLNATTLGANRPGWSPDGSRIVFFRYGEKDDSGPDPVINGAVFVIGADGQDLHQISPKTLKAEQAAWSPDGTRIVFTSWDGKQSDLYSMSPDGIDVRRLTTSGVSSPPSWTPDGRILFTRGPGDAGTEPAGWWTMDADGSNAVELMSAAAIGVAPEDLPYSRPVWQPIGGAAIVPPPWSPKTAAVVGPPAPTPTPTPIPDLAPGFSWTGSWSSDDDSPLGETATLLADGRVLFAGGCETAAQLYDPTTGTFSATGSMSVVRASATATRLPDGRVLIAGGYNCGRAGQDGTWATAELYDPATGTFSPTGSLSAPRQQHAAALLADGRVLLVGGLTGESPATAGGVILASYQTAATDSFLATAEIYDPATGKFSKTGSMTSSHRGHTATLLQDGRVLVVGNGGESTISSTAADLYDPATGRFHKTGSMKTGRWLHTATLLPDGRVLIVGGRSPKDSVYTSTEMYDPRTERFSGAGAMDEGRQQHTATLLKDGRVLIAGGYWSDGRRWNVLASTEMFDPGTNGINPVGSMGPRRQGQTATLLADGRVLIAGGEDIQSEGGVRIGSAVLYQP